MEEDDDAWEHLSAPLGRVIEKMANANGYDPDPHGGRISRSLYSRCRERLECCEQERWEQYRKAVRLEEALAVERMQFQAYREKVKAS